MMRLDPQLQDIPLAVVQEGSIAQLVTSVNTAAAARGSSPWQPVRDEHAMCDGLVTRARNDQAEAAFLTVLQRWAGKFGPWVAAEGGAARGVVCVVVGLRARVGRGAV